MGNIDGVFKRRPTLHRGPLGRLTLPPRLKRTTPDQRTPAARRGPDRGASELRSGPKIAKHQVLSKDTKST